MKTLSVSKKIKGKYYEAGLGFRQIGLGFAISKHDFYVNILWLWISVEW